MTTLYISEFSDLPFTTNGAIQAAGAQFWVADQTVAISGSSAASSAFNMQTAYVLIASDVVCSIAWTAPGAGSTNAATTSDLRIPANAKPMLFGVAPGMKLSAISNT